MSLFWNDWVGLAAFGAAFPLRPAPDASEPSEDDRRDGYGFLRWLREDRDDKDPHRDERRDPEEDRLFAAFLSSPWI